MSFLISDIYGKICRLCMYVSAFHAVNYEYFHVSGSSGSGCSPVAVSCPIRRKWFYEVVVMALSLRGKEVSIPCVKFNTDKTIVDSGTSNLRLPSEVGLSPHCVPVPLPSQIPVVNTK